MTKFMIVMLLALVGCAKTSIITGPAGKDGTNGADGTTITLVQLCPGIPVYPSKFIEVAFCINDQLYAVYSQNGGFETLLPPGTYGSNGINASCNFVVAAHCVITN